MRYFRLKQFAVKEHNNGNTLILCTGDVKYSSILIDSFPFFNFGTRFPDYKQQYDWGIFINGITSEQRYQVGQFLEFLSKVILLNNELLQSFAIDLHYQNNRVRTIIGQLAFEAKYERNAISLDKLSLEFENFVSVHPAYRRTDYFIPVPCSDPSQQGIQHHITRYLCDRFSVSDGTDLIHKNRKTSPMKDLDIEDKFNNIKGAFSVNIQSLLGKRVTLIDDIYRSGTTINEIALVLKQYGAIVQSLVATKTLRD